MTMRASFVSSTCLSLLGYVNPPTLKQCVPLKAAARKTICQNTLNTGVPEILNMCVKNLLNC